LDKKNQLISTSVNQFKVRDNIVNIPQTICYKIKVDLSSQIGARLKNMFYKLYSCV